MSGLGMLDETEASSIAGAVPTSVDLTTGEIIEQTETKVKTLREIALEAQGAAEGPQEAPEAPATGTESGETVVEDAQSIPLFDNAPEAVNTAAGHEHWDDPLASPEDLNEWEFKALATKAGLTQAVVRETARRLFPDLPAKATSRDLSDAQRGRLWIVLATEQGQ
jgi:hypothetical protein